jgi:hypothetical protein
MGLIGSLSLSQRGFYTCQGHGINILAEVVDRYGHLFNERDFSRSQVELLEYFYTEFTSGLIHGIDKIVLYCSFSGHSHCQLRTRPTESMAN